MLPRILPFALFMAFIAVNMSLDWFADGRPDAAAWKTQIELWLYPVRTILVLATLVFFWSQYEELKEGFVSNLSELTQAIGVGVLVYLLWVRMDWPWATQGGDPSLYNPFAGGQAGILLAAVRLFGAALVVPIMEELFWRSFMMRYLVSNDFLKVRLGTFTLLSFGATAVLFGVEHYYWLAGMMAGVAYNFLLYRTNRLWPCIIAHALTNLLLGIHVLVTGEWRWW